MSTNDALGNLRGKKLGVCGVDHGAQEVVHHARGAVGVGCRNEDPVGRDAGGFRGQLLCLKTVLGIMQLSTMAIAILTLPR